MDDREFGLRQWATVIGVRDGRLTMSCSGKSVGSSRISSFSSSTRYLRIMTIMSSLMIVLCAAWGTLQHFVPLGKGLVVKLLRRQQIIVDLIGVLGLVCQPTGFERVAPSLHFAASLPIVIVDMVASGLEFRQPDLQLVEFARQSCGPGRDVREQRLFQFFSC